MSDEHIDDMLRELSDELNAVRPSPEFAAKVRIAVEAQRSRRWLGLWQTAAGLVTVGAAIAIGVMFMNSRAVSPVTTPEIAGNVERSIELPPPSPVTPAPSSVPAPVVQPSSATQASAPRVAPVARTVLAADVRPARAREPEVLVPPDQRMALFALLDGMRMRGNQVPSETTALVDGEGRLPAPTEITVSPITIEPLSSPIPGGGSRERR